MPLFLHQFSILVPLSNIFCRFFPKKSAFRLFIFLFETTPDYYSM